MSDWQQRALGAHKDKEARDQRECEMQRRRRGALIAPMLRAITGLPSLDVESDSVELDGWTFSYPVRELFRTDDKPPYSLDMRRQLPGCGHIFRREYVKDAAGAGSAIADFERGQCMVCIRAQWAEEAKAKGAA